MRIEIDPTYDARTNESTPDNDQMFAAVGKRYVLPLTGVVSQFVDSPTKEGEKGAVFVVDERHGFPPGTTITLDIEALVEEPCCDSAPCDCPTSHAPLTVEGAAPGAAPGTAPAAEL